MKLFMGLVFSFVMISCNDASDSSVNGDTVELKDPLLTHPPSEAITDSTRLVNDSVIVADTTPNNGSQVGRSDSIHKNRQ